jgi:sugar/nucleoside kinase (ribokinase family)
MADFDLLVVGEINPDLIVRGPDVHPAFGQEEKLVEEATLTVGSSSAILACGAARLGLRTAFLGVVGEDQFGRYMLDAMARRGVDVSACIVDPDLHTGLSVILSAPHDRAILTYSGAIGALHPEQVDRGLLHRARHLHVGSYYLLDGLRPGLPALYAAAHEAGMTTSLDTNWDPAGRWDGSLAEVLQHCDLFLPNEAEARHIARRETLPEALDVLVALVPIVAVKLGAQGGVAYTRNLAKVAHQNARKPSQSPAVDLAKGAFPSQGSQSLVHASALPVDVVDTTGAGDSFDAGFLYGYLHGWPLERALRLACACGSLSTRAPGGTAGQPTLDEALCALGEG